MSSEKPENKPENKNQALAVRFFLPGQKPSRGQLAHIQLTQDEAHKARSLSGDRLRRAAALTGIDVDRYDLFWYNLDLQGYQNINDGTGCMELRSVWDNVVTVLVDEKPRVVSLRHQQLLAGTDLTYGYFGIGALQGNHARGHSHAVLKRCAYRFGASFVFTIGKKDTFQTENSSVQESKTDSFDMPALRFDDYKAFMTGVPVSTPLVAVEMGGTPLEAFQHPKCCAYILGSEEFGLPSSITDSCQYVVSLPSVRNPSYSIAAAASILLYDRVEKARRATTDTPSVTGATDSYKKTAEPSTVSD